MEYQRRPLRPVEAPLKPALWCCITPERYQKTQMLMTAIKAGWPGSRIEIGNPRERTAPFIVWGQEWTALQVIPDAITRGRPFFHIDNGYFRPARGSSIGYYRVTYRGMTPILLEEPDPVRAQSIGIMQHVLPWRETGTYVLYAVPGRHFGLALGIDMDCWIAGAVDRIKAATDRPIRIRPREAQGTPLDWSDCWCLVTHSSNIAVEAAIAGVPVFVEPTSAAAPIGRTDLDLENPITPDRTGWLASLMCQQFTVKEMANGTLHYWMQRVVKQQDRQCAPANEIA